MMIGVLGGSFNPIHIGHLSVAQEAAQLMKLDRVYFVVSANPPHKEKETLIEKRHRYKMVELALADNPIFYPSANEMERGGISYTIDTMQSFKEQFGDDVYFITGQDAIEEIGSWKSAAALLKTFNIVVTTRPGYDSSALFDLLQSVLSVKYANLKLKFIGKNSSGTVESAGVTGSSSAIHFVRTPMLDISSSDIRKRLVEGRSIKYLVPGVVERYLKDNKIICGGGAVISDK
ncbi:MAG TPA: nicotinate-nucleotide adenylyltransferase [Nitrospirae bacterium]|nr:nicotinate-nucleotide adenylyltransferase [Nitrospirota bacterium]